MGTDPEWYLQAKRLGLVERETPHVATYAESTHGFPGWGFGISVPPSATDVSEAEFTDAVLGLAQRCGWRRAHFRPARTAKGWRTAVAGDGKGWPDLVLLRGPVLLVAELKVGRNKPTAEQKAWLAAFKLIPAAMVFTWTPADWPLIEKTLR